MPTRWGSPGRSSSSRRYDGPGTASRPVGLVTPAAGRAAAVSVGARHPARVLLQGWGERAVARSPRRPEPGREGRTDRQLAERPRPPAPHRCGPSPHERPRSAGEAHRARSDPAHLPGPVDWSCSAAWTAGRASVCPPEPVRRRRAAPARPRSAPAGGSHPRTRRCLWLPGRQGRLRRRSAHGPSTTDRSALRLPGRVRLAIPTPRSSAHPPASIVGPLTPTRWWPAAWS